MAFEGAGRSEFAQLVSNHLFRHIHRNKFFAVVHGDGVTDEVRHNRRTPRPGLDHFLFVARVQPFDFSRRCASTNGPFFSERAISLLFLDAAQTSPRGVPHLLKSTYRARNPMRFRAERANKSRSHRIRRAVHNHRPSRLAKLVQRRLQRNRRLLLNEHRNLRHRFRNRLRRHPFCYTLARAFRARPNRCPASCCTACPCRSHRFRSSFAVCLSRECSPSSALKTSISQGLYVQLVFLRVCKTNP